MGQFCENPQCEHHKQVPDTCMSYLISDPEKGPREIRRVRTYTRGGRHLYFCHVCAEAIDRLREIEHVDGNALR